MRSPVLAHLHVGGCPCSRCSVARNYRRLLATVTDPPEADTAQPLAGEMGVPLFEADDADVRVVGAA